MAPHNTVLFSFSFFATSVGFGGRFSLLSVLPCEYYLYLSLGNVVQGLPLSQACTEHCLKGPKKGL